MRVIPRSETTRDSTSAQSRLGLDPRFARDDNDGGSQSARSAAAGSTVAARAAGPHTPRSPRRRATAPPPRTSWIMRPHFEQQTPKQSRREHRSAESDRDAKSDQHAAFREHHPTKTFRTCAEAHANPGSRCANAPTTRARRQCRRSRSGTPAPRTTRRTARSGDAERRSRRESPPASRHCR